MVSDKLILTSHLTLHRWGFFTYAHLVINKILSSCNWNNMWQNYKNSWNKITTTELRRKNNFLQLFISELNVSGTVISGNTIILQLTRRYQWNHLLNNIATVVLLEDSLVGPERGSRCRLGVCCLRPAALDSSIHNSVNIQHTDWLTVFIMTSDKPKMKLQCVYLSCLQPSSWARRLAASWAVNRHWYLSSTALNSCSTNNPVQDVMFDIHAVLGLSRLLEFGNR